jgi:hypothetical protein
MPAGQATPAEALLHLGGYVGVPSARDEGERAD